MNLPNYKNQGIVNLMASLAQVLGGNSQYEPLKGLDLSDSADKNIVLIVLDGLGYEFLQKYGKNSFLHKNLKGKMTSVFPSTTASAITSFATGLVPQQHGLTGWFVYKDSKSVPYKTLAGFFKQIKETVFCNSKRKYIYAYWDRLDSVCHKKGATSVKAAKHFWDLDKIIGILFLSSRT